MPERYAIYVVTCAANGKRYVGYTSKTAEQRFAQHLLNARWKCITALYHAIRKYGDAAFSVQEMFVCEGHAAACEAERRFIAEMGTVLPLGYNMTLGGDGVPLPRERIDEINAKKRGSPRSEKQEAASARRKGVTASEETRAKLSAARKGKAQNPDWVARRVLAFRRNRAARLGIAFDENAVEAASKPRPRRLKPGKRVWTDEAKKAERQRALAQWTPEAKEAARRRALKQWTPEARQRQSEHKMRHYAQRKTG